MPRFSEFIFLSTNREFNFVPDMHHFEESYFFVSPQEMLKKKFSCQNCPSSFKHKKYLTYHLKYECNRGPRFCCPYCDHKARFSSGSRSHIRTKHPGLRIYTIDLFRPRLKC